MTGGVYHIPALLAECLAGLLCNPSGVYVDATFGGGGHSRGILSRLAAQGRLLAFDQDIDAADNAIDDERFTFVHSNFAYLRNWLRYYGISAVDGVLADLGVSSHHFDAVERGFSFRGDSPLDMRMNRSASLTAREMLNTCSEQRLADVLWLYGELRQSRRMARAIVAAREQGKMETTAHLVEAVTPFIKPTQHKKELAQVFQALRIEVNHEMQALQQLLEQGTNALKPGGRLAIITYHSLEDRMVKNFFRTGNVEGKLQKDFFGRVSTPLKALNNKVITPGDEEIAHNPRARSAKLRIAEKLNVQ